MLLELLPPDRFRSYRSEYNPFIQALAKKRGIETHWLVLGVAHRPKLHEGNPFIFELDKEDRLLVLDRLSTLNPTHLLLNERLSEDLWDDVGRTCRRARRLLYDPVSATTFLRKLGCEIGRDDRLENIVTTPDYSRELVNTRSLSNRPFTHLMVGPECIYHRPLRDNPYFEGIDLSACDNVDGCSFCNRIRGEPLRKRAEDVAFDQVTAMIDTAPEGLTRDFLVHGAALWLRGDRFFRRLIEADVPACSFHFSARLDEIQRMAERVEKILPSLRESGHSIELSNVGLESFSPVENERFNKGISPAIIKKTAHLLHRWEREYPHTLRFWEHGGFGFITFTPWTTKDDLRRALEGLEWLSELYSIPSLSLCSRVQLLPGRALTELARRDGLLTDSFEDEVFDSGCVTRWDEQELPWRFRDPDIGALYRIARRLVGDPDLPPDDPDMRRINGWLRDRGLYQNRSTLLILELLIDLIDERGGGQPLDELLSTLETRLSEVPNRVQEAAEKRCVPPRDAEDRKSPGWLVQLTGLGKETLERVREGRPALLHGLDPVDWRPIHIDDCPTLHVRLDDGVGGTILYFQPKATAARWYTAGEALAVFHDPTTPLTDIRQRRAAAVLLRILDRLFMTLQPE